ncbi:hypothetical protein ACTG16_23205 [Aeromonas sp. 23P]|uniref:hypothetical protein n=1 Tax=Aeromonas sp. 23P TaxID=3452716 RepID=UPI003F7A01DF|nr:hypothetical protein [Aeromonas veronii]
MVAYYVLNENTLCFEQDGAPLVALVTKEGSPCPPAAPLNVGSDDVLRPVGPGDEYFFQLWMSQSLGMSAK